MTPNVLIFAGAGASMAVSAEQFPTTLEFFKRLPPEIIEFPLFRQLVSFIMGKTGQDRVDIEEILWAADELRKDLEGINSGSTVAGYCLNPNNFPATAGNLQFGQFGLAVETILGHAKWMASEINKLVYDLYSYDPHPRELKSNWSWLIKETWDFSKNFDIFTTNYDGVIESALSESGIPSRQLDEFMGLSGVRRKYINLDAWKGWSVERKGLLTKLHGSVDWKRNGDKINISDAGFSGNHERHPIIYPGFKGAASVDFFDVFHGYLQARVTTANILVFIGFAFRDEHINSIIRDSIRADAKVFIIDTNPNVAFCSARVRPTRLEKFSGGYLNTILEAVHAYDGSNRKVGRAK